MAETIPIGQFKDRCLALLDQVQRTGTPLVVTRRGRPIARITAVEDAEPIEGSVLWCGDIVSPAIEQDDWGMERA